MMQMKIQATKTEERKGEKNADESRKKNEERNRQK